MVKAKRKTEIPDENPSKLEQQGYLSARKVARKLQKSPSTIYRWLDESLVEGLQVGAARYVKLSSLIEYIGQEAAALFGLSDVTP